MNKIISYFITNKTSRTCGHACPPLSVPGHWAKNPVSTVNTTSIIFNKVIQPVFITLLPSICLADHICTDLFNFITETINIEYSLIEAVCYNPVTDGSRDDYSGSGSGDSGHIIDTVNNICRFNCTDYHLYCKSVSHYIYKSLYYTDEIISWSPEQFESVCLSWNKSLESSNITANVNNTKNVSIGILTTFGIVCAGVSFAIGKICCRR